MGMYCNIICILLLFFTCNILADDCHNIPISLDNFKLCQDSKCFIDQQVVIDIQAISGYKTCLQFISPTGDNRAQKLDISIPYAYFSYPMDNSQYFDDPKTDGKGFCGCPGGHSVSCSSNPIHVAGPLVTLCEPGVHKDNYCVATKIFGTPGTWAYKLGFDTRARFKAIKFLNKFTPFVGLKFQTNNDTWFEDYTGTVKESTYHPDFNVTVITDTMKNTLSFNYIVFDRQSPTDFWLLPGSAVNDIGSFDTSKLAWAKVGQTTNIDPDLLKKSSINLLDCKNNRFSLTQSWLNNAAWLNQNKNKLSAAIAPHAVLMDPDYPFAVTKEEPQLHISPYNMLDNGWIYLDQGTITFIGFNDHDQPVPPFYPQGFNRKCSEVIKNSNTVTFHNYGTINLSETELLYECNYGVPFVIQTQPYIRGSWIDLINKTSQTVLGYALAEYTKPTAEDLLTYKEIAFTAQHWPTGKPARLIYQHTTAYFRENLEDTKAGSSVVNIPSDNGIMQLSVHFKNFSIQFDSTLVQPQIDNVQFASSTFIVSAHSKTVPGTCVVSSLGELLFTTQSIKLDVNVVKFNITTPLRAYSGKANIMIRCASKTANSSLSINFNLTETQSFTKAFNSSNPYFEDIIDPSKWADIVSDPLAHWKHTAYIIIWGIFMALMVIMLIVILWKLYVRFRQKRRNRVKFPKMTKLL